MRNRGSVILIKNDQVALIKRIRDDITYYVFPGGVIKDNEPPEEAAKREALEEQGILVKVKDCLANVHMRAANIFI